MQSRWGWVGTTIQVVTIIGLAAAIVVDIGVLLFAKDTTSIDLWVEVPLMFVLLSAAWFTWPRKKAP